MQVPDLVIAQTQSLLDSVFRHARAVPEDRLNWKPEGVGRTILEQLQECAQSADWSRELLVTRTFHWDREAMVAIMRERESWTTIDACESIARERTERLYSAIRAFPVDDLAQTMHLPFGGEGGRDWTFAEIMGIHAWNLNYHQGQIAYIQTLYGDKNMY